MNNFNDDNDAFSCEVGYVRDSRNQIAAIFYRKVVKGNSKAIYLRFLLNGAHNVFPFATFHDSQYLLIYRFHIL